MLLLNLSSTPFACLPLFCSSLLPADPLSSPYSLSFSLCLFSRHSSSQLTPFVVYSFFILSSLLPLSVSFLALSSFMGLLADLKQTQCVAMRLKKRWKLLNGPLHHTNGAGLVLRVQHAFACAHENLSPGRKVRGKRQVVRKIAAKSTVQEITEFTKQQGHVHPFAYCFTIYIRDCK